ncbi:MAG: hypothetical protein CVU62_06570 [Deltaproteobacteria bacterium HGW-Deltaproteobacteria-2]|jgi:hypothetical protein|nr:MAG: hypothetical protein CVU62_06570 [Deltaproteobacteria bacterium HGW-Deltaproteobacteria-2]
MDMKSCRKIALTSLVITVFILFYYTLSFAQNEEIKATQFKDGSTIYGKVIKMSVDEIKIQTKDGKIISRKFDDVENFIIADNLGGIQLKDGSIIYGKIIEIDSDQVIIVTKDNNSITRKFNDVAFFINKADEEKKPPKHFFALGTEISYIKYEETGVEEKGMMYGLVGSYNYHNNKLMMKAEGKFAYGEVDYNGSTWDDIPLTISGIPDYMLEFRGLVGYNYFVKTITITPHLGIGYRWLQDNSQNKSPSGYKREANYFYIPAGIEAVADLGNNWFLGANVEYDCFLWGTQKSYLSDVDPGFNDVENKQTSGYGFRGSISITKKYKNAGFVVEPYIRYWNIEDSGIELLTYYGTPVVYGIEPSNNSTEIGCKLAVTF